jgi:hypothetical protein
MSMCPRVSETDQALPSAGAARVVADPPARRSRLIAGPRVGLRNQTLTVDPLQRSSTPDRTAGA